VNFAVTTICLASQQVFIVVSVYFVIESVRKPLDTPSYFQQYVPTCLSVCLSISHGTRLPSALLKWIIGKTIKLPESPSRFDGRMSLSE
jgi:hypothetical protein